MAVSDENGLSILHETELSSQHGETSHSGLREETGLSVLSRLCPRPSLDLLLPGLLPPPFPQLTQVTWTGNLGESNAVTSLLVELMVTTALPKSQVRSVAHHMETRVKHVADLHYRKLPQGERTRENRLTSSDQWEIVKAALERIRIMEVFTSTSLDISIISISNILSGNTNIACIIIDSISAFYYQVRATSNVNSTNYVKRVLAAVNNAIRHINSVKVVYSHHDYYKQGVDDLGKVLGEKGALLTVGRVAEEEGREEEGVFWVVGEVKEVKIKKKLFIIDTHGHLKWK